VKRDLLWLLTAASVGAVFPVALLMTLDCGGPQPPVEQITVVQASKLGDYIDKLAHCRAVGREAGSYAAYAACEADSGL
jgi:hypothetical protein